MQCLKCGKKACKSETKDCSGDHDEALSRYLEPENRSVYENADSLVSNGQAGKLSRFEEIVKFAKVQGYNKIALAYCFSMEALAQKVAEELLRCTPHDTGRIA